MRHHRRRTLTGPPVALAVALLVGACTAPEDPGTAPPSPTATSPPAAGTSVGVPDPDTIHADRLAPLSGLPVCPAPPTNATGAPAGLPLPPAAIVSQATTDGPLQSVQGFTPRTPVEVMVAYLRHEDVEVVAAEDEVFESEVLVRVGELQVFVKSQAACDRGSAFVLFASADADEVPAPTGRR